VAQLGSKGSLIAGALAAVGASVCCVGPLVLQNMTCAACPITVEKSLEHVAGVSAVKIDFANKTATVTYDPDKAQPALLTEATENAGYPSAMRK
jgi:periplasmic mercuric ion binding protein